MQQPHSRALFLSAVKMVRLCISTAQAFITLCFAVAQQIYSKWLRDTARAQEYATPSFGFVGLF